MKKKTKLTLSLFAVFLIAIATIGTVAYFSKNFVSDNNIATAASFEVDVVNANGETIGDGEFLVGDKLYPGLEDKQVYEFKIKKGNTDVPVEYNVNLEASGALFPEDASSPVVLSLQRHVDDQWTDVDNGSIVPQSDTEDFRVLVSWPHGDNDIDFQGATGKVRLDVVATQVDGSTAEEAATMLDEVEAALEALEKINNDNFIRRGNFSKAQSDAVQELLNDAKEYINGVTGGGELLKRANEIQQALDELVESRYVYYSVINDQTDFTQLQLALSADQSGQVVRESLPTPLWIASVIRDKEKFWTMRYSNFDMAEVGQVFELGLRFNGGVRTIDATFTNLGDGNWQIESDWLIEKK